MIYVLKVGTKLNRRRRRAHVPRRQLLAASRRAQALGARYSDDCELLEIVLPAEFKKP